MDKNSPPTDEDLAAHAVLKTAWNEAFAALRAAGLEASADHPVAAEYRAASNALNHSNRKRDFWIATGVIDSRVA